MRFERRHFSERRTKQKWEAMTDTRTAAGWTYAEINAVIDEVWEDTPQHTLQRYGARELRDALIKLQNDRDQERECPKSWFHEFALERPQFLTENSTCPYCEILLQESQDV